MTKGILGIKEEEPDRKSSFTLQEPKDTHLR